MPQLDLYIWFCSSVANFLSFFFLFYFFFIEFLLVNIARVNYIKWGFLDLVNYISSFSIITKILNKLGVILFFFCGFFIFFLFLLYVYLTVSAYCLDIINLFYNELLINCNIYSINNNVCIVDKIMNLHDFFYFYALLFFIIGVVGLAWYFYKELFVPYFWPDFVPQVRLTIYDYFLVFFIYIMVRIKQVHNIVYQKYYKSKQRSVILRQDIGLVLLGCLAVYLGTYMFEYMFFGDLEAFIKLYDDAARAKCARDGTFFDVQYHEGLYAYWRMSRSVQENALMLLRIGSMSLLFFSLFGLLGPKGDPKGPGSGGGSKLDSDGGSGTSGSNSSIHQSVVNYPKLKDQFNIKDSWSSSGERSSLGLASVAREPVDSFNSLQISQYIVQGLYERSLRIQNQPIKVDYFSLIKQIQDYILVLKINNIPFSNSVVKALYTKVYNSQLQADFNLKGVKVFSPFDSVETEKLYLIQNLNIHLQELDGELNLVKNKIIYLWIKRHLYNYYGFEFHGIDFSKLTDKKLLIIIKDLKQIQRSVKFAYEDIHPITINLADLDINDEFLIEFIKINKFYYDTSNLDSNILEQINSELAIEFRRYKSIQVRISNFDVLSSKLVMENDEDSTNLMFENLSKDEFFVLFDLLVYSYYH